MYASFSILHTSVPAFLPLLFLLGHLKLTWASSTVPSHSVLELLSARMLDLVVLQTSSFIWCHTWLPRLRFYHSIWKCIAWSIKGGDAGDFINFTSVLRNGEEDERAQVSSPTQLRMLSNSISPRIVNLPLLKAVFYVFIYGRAVSSSSYGKPVFKCGQSQNTKVTKEWILLWWQLNFIANELIALECQHVLRRQGINGFQKFVENRTLIRHFTKTKWVFLKGA